MDVMADVGEPSPAPAPEQPQLPAGVWRHYKGDFYQVIGIGEHTEAGELLVVYVALHARPGVRIRCRPLTGPEGFLTPVELKGMTVPRFEWIGHQIPYSTWDKPNPL